MPVDIVFKYFPNLSAIQQGQFRAMEPLYAHWNSKINVVSRKDVEELYLRHVLHSLGIARIQPFQTGAAILDVGTGGGFPGIPLAILFPEVGFTLVDAIGKKIKVVEEVVEGLGLTNVTTLNTRVENMEGEFDFIVSRAVAAMPSFVRWVKGRIRKKSRHELRNGILYLKGGDLGEELADFPASRCYPLKDHFEESFFDSKQLVHLPLKYKG